jgi:hypothetical protein
MLFLRPGELSGRRLPRHVGQDDRANPRPPPSRLHAGRGAGDYGETTAERLIDCFVG